MFKNYPFWAQEFARKYLSKTVNQFVLHGNVRDLVPVKLKDGYQFPRMKNFLSDELFGARDIVIFYDRSSGITFRDKKSQQDFGRALAGLDTASGSEFAKKLPRDPNRVFSLLESYSRIRVSDEKSIAIIIDYAETVAPVNEGGAAGTEDRNNLVYLLKWAQDPLFLAGDYTLVLLTENLTDLNRALIQSPYNSAIKVGLPGEEQRASFIQSFTDQKTYKKISDVPLSALSQQTAGLNFINLQGLLANALENKSRISFDSLSRNKKELIEAEAYGLLEFVESKYTLDDVAGHERVKKHLRDAAMAIRNGQPDVLPMGYLVCGPVGTGKTYMVNCFAGEVGVPMVKLKNFRSQWQGVTEGNLEKILTLLDAMAPVAVMIDEADAYLGDRSSSGDSGVSNRVFAQIAQFMSNTVNRGRIIWFLMTARPDLMPVDLKRQGRAEEHIALFYPSTEEERIELFQAMKKKTRLEMTKNEIPELIRSGHKMFSGADMEAALTRARFRAAAEGKKRVSPDILDVTLNDFIPPTYPEEIELQTLNAVLECTSKELLPEPYRSMSRDEVSRKVDELKLLVR
jgi:AAA+ superfamily predicted ATPase